MICYRIKIDGRITYTGLFRTAWDAIEDALNRGARTAVAVPA